MKEDKAPIEGAPVTLQDVIDRVLARPDLLDNRKRDLRSTVTRSNLLVLRFSVSLIFALW